jgi:hypothetical protein
MMTLGIAGPEEVWIPRADHTFTVAWKWPIPIAAVTPPPCIIAVAVVVMAPAPSVIAVAVVMLAPFVMAPVMPVVRECASW